MSKEVLTENVLAKKNEGLLTVVKNEVSRPINSAKVYDSFLALGASVVAQRKAVETFFKPLKKAQDLAKKAILDREHAMLDAWKPVEDRIRQETARWYAEQEKLAEEKQAALQAAAEAAHKQEMKDARAAGDKDLLKELRAEEVYVPEVINKAKRASVDFRDDVEITCVDLDLVPVEYLRREVNVSAVKKAYKEGTREIPGLVLTAKKTTVF